MATRAESAPPERHCRGCGTRMDAHGLRHTRVSPFGPHQWQAEFTCPGCGLRTGSSWSTLTPVPTSAHPLGRFLARARTRLRMGWHPGHAAAFRQHSLFLDDAGRLDLSLLVADADWPVLGLAGRPHGLRLRSPGWSGSRPLAAVHLGYVSGPWYEPKAALEIHSGPETDRVFDVVAAADHRLSAVESVLRNFGPDEIRRSWHDRHDFYRDWNLDRMARAALTEIVTSIAGDAVTVRVASWPDESVLVAEADVGGRIVHATSLGLSRDALIEALGTSTDLRRDAAALAANQADFVAAHEALLRSYVTASD